MRKLTAVGIAVLATSAAAATTASAEAPPNYGACVSTNTVDPASDPYGPANFAAAIASYPNGGTFWTAILWSDGEVPFTDVVWCPS
jgi:hypothetical protein